MRVEFTPPRAFSTVWSIWPGIALGLIFAASATVALADPAELRLRSRELTCRAPAGEEIRVAVETTVVGNVPCKRIRMSGEDSRASHSHTVWGCEGKKASEGSIRYDFDINDWPAQLTVTGPRGLLKKDSQFFPCRASET
jgi:hypothetical protein